MAYQYNPKNYEEASEPIPVGAYRVRIKEVEQMLTKNGDDMLKITFDVSGKSQSISFFLPLLENTFEQRVMTDRKIGSLLESFGQDPKKQPNWDALVGKVGACKVKHEVYDGVNRAVVHYFIQRAKQKDLPAWAEKPKTTIKSYNDAEEVVDNDLPF